MYPHQLERLTAALGRHTLDALIASSAANLAYLAGAPVAPAAKKRPALVVMGPAGTALVIAAEDAGATTAAVDHVMPYRGDGCGAAIASALDTLGATDGAIGLDTGGLAPAQARAIAAALGDRNVVEGSGVLLEARLVKSPWEIETIERALLAAEHGLNAVVQEIEPGMTELEATALFEAEVVRRRANPRVSRITFGERTADLAAAPSSRRLRKGDLVRLDVGCTAEGYHAEVARTAVMGPAGDRESSMVEAIEAGVDAAISAMHAEVRAGAVVQDALEAVRTLLPGYVLPSIGHGIGLDPKEPPSLEPASEVALEAEMVLVIDLPYVDASRGAARITETVLVSRRSARALNRSQRGLLVL